MLKIDNCNCLNDIARQEFGKANYTNREKVKKLLAQEGINWQDWLSERNRKEDRYCINCGKLLKSCNKKFCSRSCSVSFNNKNRKRKIEKNCINCGKKLDNNKLKYCCNNCQTDYEHKQYIKRWKQGLENGLRGEYQLSKHIYNYLISTRGCTCELCGWHEINPYTKTIPIEIHHKDGNYLNNTEENLQILCPNCHSLTETHKSHNKNGRKARKKYYKK